RRGGGGGRGGRGDGDFGAFGGRALGVGVVGGVRALKGVPKIDDPPGDPAHADTADADEVDRTDVARQFHRGSPRIVLTTRSASRSAASMAPCERAAAAIATSFCGALASAPISVASRSGVKSSCRRRIAPPAFASTPALADWS